MEALANFDKKVTKVNFVVHLVVNTVVIAVKSNANQQKLQERQQRKLLHSTFCSKEDFPDYIFSNI